MLAYPPIEIRAQLDKETWDSVVVDWLALLSAGVNDVSDFLVSYVRNAGIDDVTPLRSIVFKMIVEEKVLHNPSVETIWSLIELYGSGNVTRVTNYITTIPNMIPKLRRLALHYVAEDHSDSLECIAVLLANEKIAKLMVNDDWFRQLSVKNDELSRRIATLSQRTLEGDSESVSIIQDMFPQVSAKRGAELLRHHSGSVEAVTAYLLEHPEEINGSSSATIPTAPSSNSGAKLGNYSMGKKERKVTKADKSHLETTLRLLYEADEDERDDTYDDAEVHDEEQKTSAAVDKIEQYMWYLYRNEPDALTTNSRKSKKRQEIKKKTDWSDEQIEGWAKILERQPRRKTMLEDKYFGQRDNEVDLLYAKSHKQATGNKDEELETGTSTANPQQSTEKTARDQKYRDRNKARFGNHSRKAGHAKKMQT